MAQQLGTWLTLLLAALAWIRFAQHPTARNLRAALTDTLTL